MSTQFECKGIVLNRFTFKDHAIARRALSKLQGHEHSVILLRFWQDNTIYEIAEALGLTCKEVEKFMAQAFLKIKAECLGDEEFSRSIRMRIVSQAFAA